MSKWAAVVIAFVLGVVLTVAAIMTVILLEQQKVSDGGDGDLVTVIVPTQSIPANRSLDPLIDQGVFVEVQIPHDMVVEAVVADLGQLRGATTTAAIVANEQIPATRLAYSQGVDDPAST